ncbi:MAG: hypothetical protein WBE15_11620, partial [Candidatus Cybelea sp.]
MHSSLPSSAAISTSPAKVSAAAGVAKSAAAPVAAAGGAHVGLPGVALPTCGIVAARAAAGIGGALAGTAGENPAPAASAELVISNDWIFCPAMAASIR